MPQNTGDDEYNIVHPVFWCVKYMQKWGKSVTIVFCVSHILRFKKFLIENEI